MHYNKNGILILQDTKPIKQQRYGSGVHKALGLAKHTTDGMCFYCRELLTKENATIDHYVPLSKGGEDREWNFRPSCTICNALKSDMQPTTGIWRKDDYDYD